MIPASVVICSRNRPRFLLEAVESVLAGDALPVEILVIDQSDAEHPQLARMGQVRGCKVRYLRAPPRGVSHARNLGCRAATQSVVAYTDDDVLVTRGWLAALVGAVGDPGGREVATGRVLATESEVPGGFAPALVASEEPAVYVGRVRRDVLEAGNMAVPRAVMLELGGFDERLGPGTAFPAGEDNDMGLRLLAAGCTVRYVPAAAVHHRAWRGAGEYLPLRWRYGVGQGAYYAKHLSLRDGFMTTRFGRLLRHHLWLALRRAPRSPKPALGHLVYVAGALTGAARWRRRP
jgi:GT2 family glycosyltransferase